MAVFRSHEVRRTPKSPDFQECGTCDTAVRLRQTASALACPAEARVACQASEGWLAALDDVRNWLVREAA
jgi:hypothetical protein